MIERLIVWIPNPVFVLDVLLLLALVAMITSALLLYRRLGALQKGREEMARLLSEFSSATLRADHAVQGMKNAAAETGEKLQDRIREGQALLDELSFILEAGSNLADRLDGNIQKSRVAAEEEDVASESRPKSVQLSKTPQEEEEKQPVSRAERELMRVMNKIRSRKETKVNTD